MDWARARSLSNQKDLEMSKAADKPVETVEVPTLDPGKAVDQLSAIAEKGVEQSKEALTKFMSSADDTQKALTSTFDTARWLGNELSLKTIAALRANAEADFSQLEALVGAKSPSDVIELQAAYLRKRVEMGVEQAKQFQALTTKAVADVSKPIQEAVEKVLTDLKVA
jgi:phasin